MEADPSRNRQATVFRHVQQAVLSGVFAPGARLPPTRAMATELGVSRQTVVFAYERLIAEGYLQARSGVGTYVSHDLPDPLPDSALSATNASPPATSAAIATPTSAASHGLSRRGERLAALASTAGQDRSTLLLAPGVPSPELFPTRHWATCLAAAARANILSGYPDPQGLPELRAQIATHLAATRGLVVDPQHVVVTAGTQQAIRLAADLLLDPGDQVWVEDPGYIAGRAALLAAGAVLVPVPSHDSGLDVAAGRAIANDARMALVAPSHATPRGGALPVAQRLALLDWARAADARIIEDDCDSEFRWEGKPLPPLATLDRASRTIYCGTFSKTLAPGLRIGFAVFPPTLTAAAVQARAAMDRGPGTPVQAALAEFMRRGLLAPHIRRVRTEYAARRLAVLEALARHCPAVTPVHAPGGLHLTLELPETADERTITIAARALGLGVAPLGAYRIEPGPPALVIGFASTPAALAAGCAQRLARAIQHPPSRKNAAT